MTRLGANKPFYKKYMGFLIGFPVAILFGAMIIYLVTDVTDEQEFFFEEYSCLQLLQLNSTANQHRFVSEAQKERVYELLEEKECSEWTLIG